MKSSVKQSIFIITGMHRSGTSLTASLLQDVGVDVGERLVPPIQGNVKGYFENIDFLEFHQKVLASQALSESGWVIQGEIKVEDQYVEVAKEIVSRNSRNPIWGWKDPRTTLFLDFWATLLPEANFLFLYRSPWEVVDSLYRRAMEFDQVFFSHPDLAVKVWIHYNQKILDFYSRFPERCLLTSVYHVSNKTQDFFNTINQRFQLDLPTPVSDIYDESLLKTQVSNTHRPTLLGYYFPQAIEIYKELSIKEVQPNGTPDFSWLKQIKSSPYKNWAFHDWASICTLEAQNKRLNAQSKESQAQLQQTQAELEKSQAQLQQAQAELEQSQSQLQQTQAKLDQTHSQLQQTQVELERSQAQLQQTQAELERSQAQLNFNQGELEQVTIVSQDSREKLSQMRSHLQLAQDELKHAQSLITAMESSKFWMLRKIWFRWKRMFQLKENS